MSDLGRFLNRAPLWRGWRSWRGGVRRRGKGERLRIRESRRNLRLGLHQGILGFHRRAPRQVLLMPLSLRVCEVVPLIVVQREAQLALVLAQVISHEVRVLVKVYRLLRQLT